MHSCAPNSYVCIGWQYMHMMLYQRMINACLEVYLSSWISHATLNHSKDAFDSRAVVKMSLYDLYFQVMCVSTHKWLIRKRLWCMFGAITHQLYLTSGSNTENRHLRLQSSCSICRMSIYDLYFSSYECKYTQNVVLWEGAMCVWIHVSLIVFHIQPLTQKIDISNSRAVVR